MPMQWLQSFEPLPVAIWYSIVGMVLVFMALAGSRIKQLPLSASIVYLGIGWGLTSGGFLEVSALKSAAFIEHLTEVVVIVSLFSVGLKLRADWRDRRWILPVRLAFGSMCLTVAGIAVAAHYLFQLSWGLAILLGAILAPTDPVLASDVQVGKPSDRDLLRFTLTGEGGLNDGTAFPFVMLGLGLLGLHELGEFGWRWLAVDVLWGVVGGLVIGAVLGRLIGGLCLYLRKTHREAVGLDDFLALGLIASSYGLALLLHAYGFLAVFAAGAALRRIEMGTTPRAAKDTAFESVSLDDQNAAVDPSSAPAYMTRAVLGFNEQLERIGEVVVVILVGALINEIEFSLRLALFAAAIFFLIRPLAIKLSISSRSAAKIQRRFMGWFGIRGIGSIYYLSYAIAHGLPEGGARELISMTLFVVALSVVMHGITVTPLMAYYEKYFVQRRRLRPKRRVLET